MEPTKLEVEVSENILQNLYNTKLIVEKQTKIFENLLISKIVENFKEIDKERLQNLFIKTFTLKINDEIDAIFKYYQENEIQFYSKNLKTTDLIFNTLNDKRTQTIYLENLIKKISRKEDNLETIFTESIKNRVDMKENDEYIIGEDTEKYMSINSMFDQFVRVIIKNPNLSFDESEDLNKLVMHYYNLYKNDVSLAIKKLLDDNKITAITKIEDEMDKKEIRNGKTSAISRMERSITNNSLKAIEQLLKNTVSKYKNKAEEELKVCSSSVVDLIFRLLPPEYRDQKGLLEIIVDTNINERLGKLLDTETKTLLTNLQAKNQDIIENELYEEKRYKKISDYECNFDLVDKVYQDVLHEITIAYDIPEAEQQLKRLHLIVLSESNSTKNVFKNLIAYIRIENEKNLKDVITEMRELSEKLHIEKYDDKKSNSSPQKG